jgi:hypothetical protein
MKEAEDTKERRDWDREGPRSRRDCAAIHPSDAGNAIPRDGRRVVSIRRPAGI